MNENLFLMLENLVSEVGETRAKSILRDSIGSAKNERELTVIANHSHHKIPFEYLHGDVYVASEGSMDFSNPIAVENSVKQVLRDLRVKLKEASWKRIYFIPTGHPVVSIQIKLLIYKVTRINSIDLFYLDGNFVELDLDVRRL